MHRSPSDSTGATLSSTAAIFTDHPCETSFVKLPDSRLQSSTSLEVLHQVHQHPRHTNDTKRLITQAHTKLTMSSTQWLTPPHKTSTPTPPN
ncbi:hypothetical protein Bca4012_020758 [Brassica carinata]